VLVRDPPSTFRSSATVVFPTDTYEEFIDGQLQTQCGVNGMGWAGAIRYAVYESSP
jgi:hypothetical protein